MKQKMNILSCLTLAAGLLSFNACSTEDLTQTNKTVSETRIGHPLTINASIGNNDNSTKKSHSRVGTEEDESGLKLTWEKGDKIYLLTSTDGTVWDDTYYTFSATKVDETDAAKATFRCDDFLFPEGTTKVKFVYNGGTVASAANLQKDGQQLGTQSGALADIGKNLFMESEALDASSEDDVKALVANLAHDNSIMKLSLGKGDVEWGDDFTPTEITLTLKSETMQLLGTSNNTITISNADAAWNDDQLIANVVVCMDGTISDGDRWIIKAQDKLGNTLVKATPSAKALTAGLRYLAPITFSTADYFPMLADYVNLSYFNDEANMSTFDEKTRTFDIPQNGTAGWGNTDPATTWNLSAYKYLVIDFSEVPTGAGTVTLRDENSCWASPCEKSFGTDTRQVVFDLTSTLARNDGATLNISNINSVGFFAWTAALTIDKVYLTNTQPEEPGKQPESGKDDEDTTQTTFSVKAIGESGENAW